MMIGMSACTRTQEMYAMVVAALCSARASGAIHVGNGVSNEALAALVQDGLTSSEVSYTKDGTVQYAVIYLSEKGKIHSALAKLTKRMG